ncbi:MAG TPA: lipopolysaccharide transport periplasmic protein LptA [Polynucleobacter sp.]|jgi:lipopolysaccharide export system protein LptA|nr:MAG: lipopolysaccharide transport periplasmic protein LptA [Polynucleobacter sp. 16-46-70]HQR83628.1 lipopolysaccharide transport periplasmic protein LptA [Polynucleobacter sp.]HQS60290.1 lipopolysaccharide transport periplasmic protein LptA [Polynucleobacter sp.]HQT19983.1 lipopolysaccharide transport periplasmic protein LptA [Polynucleobacter sp.]HQT40938.1 lipopolysaccharide transport periplasmic protein LptA [Polynucleobacter sp.]
MRFHGSRSSSVATLLSCCCFIFCIQVAYAEKADQDKPIILEAGKVSINDVQQIYDLEGELILIKGSILITGEKGNIKVDPEGYEYVDVKGNANTTASFRQKREGPADEFMQGRGQTVVYNAKTELLTLTGDASLKRLDNMQMIDQLRGWKIDYDDVTQYYQVSPQANAKPDDLPQARAILSPRRKATLQK